MLTPPSFYHELYASLQLSEERSGIVTNNDYQFLILKHVSFSIIVETSVNLKSLHLLMLPNSSPKWLERNPRKECFKINYLDLQLIYLNTDKCKMKTLRNFYHKSNHVQLIHLIFISIN